MLGHSLRARRRASAIALVVASVTGCLADVEPPASGRKVDVQASTQPAVDETAVIADALRYRGDGFVRITPAPFTSALGGRVIVYVSKAGATAYARVASGARASPLPRGTTIVRAILDERGDPAKLTLMRKGPSGYDPDGGDWWFAVTDARGVVQTKDGVRQAGAIPACADCHRARATSDYLFGVDARYQAVSPATIAPPD